MRYTFGIITVLFAAGGHLLLSRWSEGRPYLLIPGGALLCLLAYGIWQLLTSKKRSDIFLPGAFTGAGILVGGLVAGLVGTSDSVLIEFMAAVLGAGIVFVVAMRMRKREEQDRCRLCNGILSRKPIVCPRCGYEVCERSTCWQAEHLQCSDCWAIRRPVFPVEDDWWRARLGTQQRSGTCHRCDKKGADVDLRQCGNCLWLLCTDCWDFENGQCARCFWRIPNLPRALRALLPADSVEDESRSPEHRVMTGLRRHDPDR
ncbi:DUF2975 domain-containing protein [Acidobacteriota bacterium]